METVTDEPSRPSAIFPVVGMGASAGGLLAFEKFFSAIPPGEMPGMAFVLVQHLAPDHKSILTELIQRCTSMEVLQVEHGMVVRPNCVFIIPPNYDMALMNGAFQLLEPAMPRGRRLPIDFFFESIARGLGERAIGIVFSGTGRDGTLGLTAIKAEGGTVLVQAPHSAEFDGMPNSAIATGLADEVLQPDDMPAALLAQHATAARPGPNPPTNLYDSLFSVLRAGTGHDFSQYKLTTVHRRVQRRMALHQIASVEDYVRLLEQKPDEVNALFRDLLIRVTSFFRDPGAFETLNEQLAKLVREKEDGAAIRVWVAGCTTGEEAYSLAILLQEQMAAQRVALHAQVFATDIDAAAIDKARQGIYPASIAADVSTVRLARHFELEPGGQHYRVRKGTRDLLVFSKQDVTKDPPFSRVDLLSCRNVMIYMGAELQRRLIPLFHYALNPNGLLFLGTSESIGEFRELFTLLDSDAKVYQRRNAPVGHRFGGHAPGVVFAPAHRPLARTRPLRDLTERTLLKHIKAAAALVTESGDILYLHGRTGSYLEPAPGESSLNVLAMARPGLHRDLMLALREAVATQKSAARSDIQVRANGHIVGVNLTVRPVGEQDAHLHLVVFEETERVPIVPLQGDDVDEGIASIRQEMRDQGEFLEATQRDLMISNDELKSANEELQSLNEELQSTNEELETSKEELQSVNEELATVNAELQQRVIELSRSYNDMNNLMAGTGVGTLFVDNQLCIQRYTPAATAVINLIPTDIGRPLAQITANLIGYDQLIQDLGGVLDTLAPREVQVMTASAWYLLRIRPYRTLENVIEGAVITFTDITELKRGVEGLQRLAVVVRDTRDAIIVQDLDGHILAWNPGATRLYGWTEAEALMIHVDQLTPERDRAEARQTVAELARAASIAPYRAHRIAKDGRAVLVDLTASALTNKAGEVYAISSVEREQQGER